MSISKTNTRPALVSRAVHGIDGENVDDLTLAMQCAARGVDVTLDCLEEVGRDEDGPLYRWNLGRDVEPAGILVNRPSRDRWVPAAAAFIIGMPFALGLGIGWLIFR